MVIYDQNKEDVMLDVFMPDNTIGTEPKYAIGQRVEVQGWTRSAFGKIQEIRRVYHRRLRECVWGYRCEYEGNAEPPLNFVYVPEGYLREENAI
jgi:hypothetical protein